MRLISKKKIREYCQDNAQALLPLTEWYYVMEECNAKNIIELRQVFKSADPVNGYTIFNIGGNKYRLVTAIHYNAQICYIRAVWTHAEYSKTKNQTKLRLEEV